MLLHVMHYLTLSQIHDGVHADPVSSDSLEMVKCGDFMVTLCHIIYFHTLSLF